MTLSRLELLEKRKAQNTLINILETQRNKVVLHAGNDFKRVRALDERIILAIAEKDKLNLRLDFDFSNTTAFNKEKDFI